MVLTITVVMVELVVMWLLFANSPRRFWRPVYVIANAAPRLAGIVIATIMTTALSRGQLDGQDGMFMFYVVLLGAFLWLAVALGAEYWRVAEQIEGWLESRILELSGAYRFDADSRRPTES